MLRKWILRIGLIIGLALIGYIFTYQTGARLQYLPVKNGQLEYVRFGSGSPIVIISGYSADIASWNDRFLQRLATQHEVILFNNRNIGNSSIQSNCYTTHCLADDTHQLIQGLHLKKPAILGYSMGGLIAQQLAVTYPDDVGKLILMSTYISGHQSVLYTDVVKQQLFTLPRNPLKRFYISLQLFFPKNTRFNAAYELLFLSLYPCRLPNDIFSIRGSVGGAT